MVKLWTGWERGTIKLYGPVPVCGDNGSWLGWEGVGWVWGGGGLRRAAPDSRPAGPPLTTQDRAKPDPASLCQYDHLHTH